MRIKLISDFADEKSDQIRNKKSSSKEVNMGYWFSGFFLRTTAQDNLPELVSSIKEQWPRVVCRLIKEPFVGLGVRMTNFTWDVDDEKGEEQLMPYRMLCNGT